MNTKQLTILAAVLMGAVAAEAASPSTSVVAVEWNPDLRRAKVTYALANAPAVITADFLTNGVSVGGVRQRKTYGDVNQLVAVGSGKALFWQADDDLVIGESVRLDVVLRAWATDNPPPYLAVDLTVGGFRRYYASADFVPKGPTDDLYRFDKLLLRRIPAAGVEWVMGSPASEANREPDGREQQVRVRISDDYYIGVHEISQHQVAMLGGGAGVAHEVVDRRPELPSNRLNVKKLRGTAKLWPADGHEVSSSTLVWQLREVSGDPTFDLPTSAQWEYAARGGRQTRFYWGTDENLSTNYEWTAANAKDGMLRRGGLLKPNPWGLYDVLGSVQELVLDWYEHPRAYSAELFVDPKGPAAEVPGFEGHKAIRGGKIGGWSTNGRCAFVNHMALDYDGMATFRPVCAAVAR